MAEAEQLKAAQEQKEEDMDGDEEMDPDEHEQKLAAYKKGKRRSSSKHSKTIDIDDAELSESGNVFDAIRAKLKSADPIQHPEFQQPLGKVVEEKTLDIIGDDAFDDDGKEEEQ